MCVLSYLALAVAFAKATASSTSLRRMLRSRRRSSTGKSASIFNESRTLKPYASSLGACPVVEFVELLRLPWIKGRNSVQSVSG